MKKTALSFLLLWTLQGWADGVSDALQAKLNHVRTMTASFTQVVSTGKRKLSQSSGTMALSRPGRFRWHTTQPMAQLVLADGEHLWVYDVELEQVSVRKQQKGLGGTAALFLSGYDDTVARDFNVTYDKKGQKDYYDLKAKSNKANFQRIMLIFSGDTLTGLELFDQLGQRTKVTLSQIKNNPTLAKDLFKFTPPKGVDVVKQ